MGGVHGVPDGNVRSCGWGVRSCGLIFHAQLSTKLFFSLNIGIVDGASELWLICGLGMYVRHAITH